MCYDCRSSPLCEDKQVRAPASGGPRFENDSWSNWHPDAERAFREHDPALEPYASMTREEILEAMLDARGGQEWEFLREFLLDKCSADERRADRFLAILAGDGGPGRDLFATLNEMAGMATRLIPVSPPPAAPAGPDLRLDPPVENTSARCPAV